MKKLLTKIIVLIALFALISCEESISPKSEFNRQYILYCIINADTSYQTAFISKSYDAPDFNPASVTDDPAVKGAGLQIFYNDSLFTFRDTSVDRQDTSRYNTPLNFYYINNLMPAADKPMQIKAVLRNGSILTAETRTPKSNKILFFSSSDEIVPTETGRINIAWRIIDAENAKQVYLPKLVINYLKEENGLPKKHQFEVPLNYINTGSDIIPNYPLPTNRSVVQYEQAAFDRAMQELSRDDSQKDSYTILNAVLELIIMDNNLAPYYFSTESFLDGYTIILDELNFTNIEGGLGVFGSFFKETQYKLIIDNLYVISFGYKHQ